MKIEIGQKNEMMAIYKDDGDCIFYGNFWDFDSTPEGIKAFLDNLDIEVELVEKEEV